MRGWPFLDGSKAKSGQSTALCVDSVIGTNPRGFWSAWPDDWSDKMDQGRRERIREIIRFLELTRSFGPMGGIARGGHGSFQIHVHR